uniref:Uncharacterized protein n=1 Tax=Tanacetum cinerariifolium TaxID=118510 RepID=A0A699HJC1_TANCI|nr:hypothetical protein [Tanacetum cinerariifolium]
MEDNSWSGIILTYIYNTFYKDEAQEDKETEVAKESEDMPFSIMKEMVQVSSDEDDYSDEGLIDNEDVILFNDVKYPPTDAEKRMFKERPTTSRAPSTRSRAPTASTSTRFRAPTASTSNAQAASTLAPRGYMKIAMTGCVLSLRAPDDPNAPPSSATRKKKSKK